MSTNSHAMPSSQPKIVLHDHLDGGVRPQTAIELAAEIDIELPTLDPVELALWFTITPAMEFGEAWRRFDVAIAVLQSRSALRRVAREAIEDLAADGVVYAELRFAPLNHLRSGLDPDDVLEAVVEGLAEGEEATGCVTRLIVCGIREEDPERSLAAARLAVDWQNRGVVGFDLAGNEFDFGVDAHIDAFRVAREGGLGITVHAGEMAGVESIAAVLEHVGPDRIGHGLHLIEDCEVDHGRVIALGPVAQAIVASNVMLEVCITSNSCLGTPREHHPVRLFHDAGIAVSVNPDDRAITTTTVADEYRLWRHLHGFTDGEFRLINMQALEAAFADETTKAGLRPVLASGWG